MGLFFFLASWITTNRRIEQKPEKILIAKSFNSESSLIIIINQ